MIKWRDTVLHCFLVISQLIWQEDNMEDTMATAGRALLCQWSSLQENKRWLSVCVSALNSVETQVCSDHRTRLVQVAPFNETPPHPVSSVCVPLTSVSCSWGTELDRVQAGTRTHVLYIPCWCWHLESHSDPVDYFFFVVFCFGLSGFS